MNVLVIAAHPDDEVLGVGGTIAKHISSGDNVNIMILSGGITSRDNVENIEKEVTGLNLESRNAILTLGVEINNVHYYDFPDNMFDSIPLLEIVKIIEKKINEIKPDVVYTHFYGDLNIDHQIVSLASITACRPLSGVKKVLCYEVLSSTEQKNMLQSQIFNPNYFVDIEDYLKLKINAMQKYKKELRDFPHPRSLEGIEILAKYRGISLNKKAIEAFLLVREVL